MNNIITDKEFTYLVKEIINYEKEFESNNKIGPHDIKVKIKKLIDEEVE